jgi:hypothetical protein
MKQAGHGRPDGHAPVNRGVEKVATDVGHKIIPPLAQPFGPDDLCNSVAGALVAVTSTTSADVWIADARQRAEQAARMAASAAQLSCSRHAATQASPLAGRRRPAWHLGVLGVLPGPGLLKVVAELGLRRYIYSAVTPSHWRNFNEIRTR